MQFKGENGIRLAGFYRGEVLKHEDGGKCKIFVPGVYPDIYKNDPNNIPDAEQASPLFGGVFDGNGMFSYPNIGSKVWVFFENCDQNRPVYFASILGGPTPQKTSGEGFMEIRQNKREDDDDKTKDTTITGEDSITHMIVCGDSRIVISESGKVVITCKETPKLQEETEEIDEFDEEDESYAEIVIDKDGLISINASNQIELNAPKIDINGDDSVNINTSFLNINVDTSTEIDSPQMKTTCSDSYSVKSKGITMDASEGSFVVIPKIHSPFFLT